MRDYEEIYFQFKTFFFSLSLFLLEAKVVIFLCYNKLSQMKADAITERIKEGLVDKNVKILWKQDESTKRSPLTRSRSCPSSEGRATKSTKMGSGRTQGASPLNPEDLTLLLKTRLRHGKISYDEKDVEKRAEGWTAPQMIADDFQSTMDAELRIYQNTKTGNHEVVVNREKDNVVSQVADTVKGTLESVASYLPDKDIVKSQVDVVTGTLQSVTSRLPSLFGRGNTSPPKDSPHLD